MAQLVAVEYMYIFDTSNTWTQLSQFEQDLNQFFTEKGFTASMIKSAGSTKRIVVVTRNDVINQLRRGADGKPAPFVPPGQRIRDVQSAIGVKR